MTDEVRVTSATGGQKGKKRAQLGAVDPQSLMALARVAGFGAEKYARYNMLNGYDWSLSYDALQRHLHAFWSGEDRDAESGELHLAHAAWHCLTLTSFLERNLGTDDRYSPRTERLRAGTDLTERAGTPAPGVYGPHQGADWLEVEPGPEEGDVVRNAGPDTERVFVQRHCGIFTDHTPHEHGVDFWCIG